VKILLVYPNNFTLLSPPPVGLSMVARAAREAGHDVRLLDCMGTEDRAPLLAQALAEDPPELVGFNLRNVDNQDIRDTRFFIPEYAALVAQANQVAPTVVGGTALMAMPERVFEASGASYGLCGEGVRSFVPWLEELAAGATSFETPGAMWREGDATHMNAHEILGYGAEGRIDWSWMDLARYRKGDMPASVITKTGCAHRCLFCDANQRFGGRFLARDPEIIVEDLLHDASEYGHNRYLYFFIDPCFNQPLDWAKQLCEAIIRAEIKLGYTALVEPTADMDQELVDLMKRSGCIMTTSLVSSLEEGMQQRMQRPGSLADIARCFGMLEKAGISVMPQLLLGGPGENQQTVEANFKFLEGFSPILVDIGWGLRIPPGADLYPIALAEGVVDKDTDMLQPQFYLSDQLDPEWIEARIKAWKRWRMPKLWQWARLIGRSVALRF